MKPSKRAGGPNGWLILNKPAGVTSNFALSKVKRLYGSRRGGHVGSLDPIATGMLPICLGEATKFSSSLLDAAKEYYCWFKLGERTDTGDADGQVVSGGSLDDINENKLRFVLDGYRGEIEQVPPMYSAVKHQGQRLYNLARQGIVVERKARKVTIKTLDLVELDWPLFRLRVQCSKGTYIRVLADDIGEELGCGAHMTDLFRSQVGMFQADTLIELEELERMELSERLNALLPCDAHLESLPQVMVSEAGSQVLLRGQFFPYRGEASQRPRGSVRLVCPLKGFIGLGVVSERLMIEPRRLVVPTPVRPLRNGLKKCKTDE